MGCLLYIACKPYLSMWLSTCLRGDIFRPFCLLPLSWLGCRHSVWQLGVLPKDCLVEQKETLEEKGEGAGLWGHLQVWLKCEDMVFWVTEVPLSVESREWAVQSEAILPACHTLTAHSVLRLPYRQLESRPHPQNNLPFSCAGERAEMAAVCTVLKLRMKFVRALFSFFFDSSLLPRCSFMNSLKEKKRRKLYRSIKASFNPLSFPLLLFLPLLSLVTGNQCVYMAGILSGCRWGHRSSTVTGLLHSHLAVLPSQPPFISIRIPSLPLALLSLSPFVPPWRARASSEFRGETSP